MKRTLSRLFVSLIVISMLITPVSAQPVPQQDGTPGSPFSNTDLSSLFLEEVPEEIQEMFANGLTPEEFVQIAGFVPNSLLDIVQGEALMIIELEDPPLALRYAEQIDAGQVMTNQAMQNYRSQIESAQQQLQASLSPLNVTVISNYTTVYNGMQVLLPLNQLNAVRALPGVKALHRAPLHEPSLASSVNLIGARDVWDDLGYTGDGVTIAIIDTGIDYTHATFGGSGDPADYEENDPDLIEPGTFPTAKVIGGYDFAGTTYNASPTDAAFQPIPEPDEDPLDENGHGTHVGSAAAGSGGGLVSQGVAPDATLMALKVFGRAGSTTLVIDALEFATDSYLTNGYPQVINMSLGAVFGTSDPNDPSVSGTNNAIAAGIVVVASAGNNEDVEYITGTPATASGAISVAASTTGFATGPTVTISDTQEVFIYYPASFEDGTGHFTEEVVAPLGYAGNLPGATDDLLCDISEIDPGALEGQIALIQRGGCFFSDKVNNAAALGAVAALIYNNVPGVITMSGEPVAIPAASLQRGDGETLAAADGAIVVVSAEDDVQTVIDPFTPADSIAGFSSRGPRGFDSFLKPEITAPGAGIFAARMGGGTTGVSMSGTSMASPHVSGVAALMLEAQPVLTPEQVKAILMNTVDPLVDDTPIPRSGSGRVNAYRAVSAQEFVAGDDDLVSLSWGLVTSNEDSLTSTKTLSIGNNRGSDLVLDIDWNFQNGSNTTGATLVVPAEFTAPDGQVSDLEVTLELDFTQIPSVLANLEEYYGWVTLTPQDGDTTPLVVPFYFQPRPYTTLDLDTSGSFIDDPETDVVEIDITHTGPIASSLGIMTAVVYNETPNPDVHGSADIRLFGMDHFVHTTYGDIVVTGINTWDKWHVPQPYIAEFDLYLDVDQDGQWDFINFNWNLGAAQGGPINNLWVVIQLDLEAGMLFLGSPFTVSTDFNSGLMQWFLPAEWQGMVVSTFDYMLVGFDAFGTPGPTPPGSFDYLNSPLGWTISNNPGPANPEATAQVWIQNIFGHIYADVLGAMLIDRNGNPSGGGQAYFEAIETGVEVAHVQIAHLAPFAEDASVTITLNGVEALTNVNYGDSTGYNHLPAGEYDVAVIPTGATDPAIEATVTFEPDTFYTVLAVGDGDNQPLDLILLEDDLTPPAAGQFHLRLGHLAPFASGSDVLADVRLQDGTPILENVDYGDITGFIPLPAGEYDLKITTPGGDTTLIDPLPVTFDEGTIISAFATGDGDNQPLGVFALPAGSPGFFLPLEDETETDPNASFTAPDTVFVNTPVNFVNTTTGTEPIDYFWDFGDGTGTSTAENPTYTYTEPGLYNVTLTAENEVGTDTYERTILVTPALPDTDLSLDISISPTPVMVGVETTITVVVTNDGPGAATGVRASAQLPDSIEFVRGENCEVDGDNVLTCDLGTIPAGESETAVVVLIFTATGSFEMEVTVGGNEPDSNMENNSFRMLIVVGEHEFIVFMPLIARNP